MICCLYARVFLLLLFRPTPSSLSIRPLTDSTALVCHLFRVSIWYAVCCVLEELASFCSKAELNLHFPPKQTHIFLYRCTLVWWRIGFFRKDTTVSGLFASRSVRFCSRHLFSVILHSPFVNVRLLHFHLSFAFYSRTYVGRSHDY